MWHQLVLRFTRPHDEEGETSWTLRTRGGSGHAFVPGPLDNDKFDFKSEIVREACAGHNEK